MTGLGLGLGSFGTKDLGLGLNNCNFSDANNADLQILQILLFAQNYSISIDVWCSAQSIEAADKRCVL